MKSKFLAALSIGAFVIGSTAGAQTVGHGATASRLPELPASVLTPRITPGRDSSRTYDAQALRFESRWGSVDIIRGSGGSVVGTVGWFRSFDVEKLVESSPHAVSEARVFQQNSFRGSLVGGLGAATLGIGIIIASNSSNNAASPILIIAGAGAIGWGAQHINRAYSALSRSLWWYNRDLRADLTPSPASVARPSRETNQR
jgi:hypothetical protein